MFDELTNNAIAEISSSYRSEAPINDKLIDNYILTLDFATIQQPSYFQSIIPLVNQTLLDSAYPTIDPTGILIKLLGKILSYLSFKQVLEYYPADFILENLFSSSASSIICLKILTLNIHESETKDFLSFNHVITKLLTVFFKETTPILVLNLIESLVSAINSKEGHLLEECTEILSLVRKLNNTILLARLLDLLLILTNKFNLDMKMYNFEREEIAKFMDDPLFLILLIQFYVNLTGSDVNIDESIANVLILFKKGEFDDIVDSEVAELIAAMSYHSYDSILSNFEVFKSYNFIKIYEKDEVELKLLSKSNPEVVYTLNASIYDDVLKHLPLLDHAYLPILLNFIASPNIWTSLQTKLTNERLESLSKDKLYQLLLAMSRYNHSKEYLFNNLPNIMSNEVIGSDIRNNDIWKIKLQILENLKRSDDVPGAHFWETKIEGCYNLMKFGQSYKHVQPKVEVIDDTM